MPTVGPVSYSVITTDRFGRYVVVAWAGRTNLSCWQLQARQAVDKPHWDNGGLISSHAASKASEALS